MASLLERFLSKVDTSGDCWMWTASRGRHGYGQLSTRHGAAPAKAHRVSFELFSGPIPDGLEVCHSCDTPSCVRPSHLFLGTHHENILDAAAKGRIGVHPNSVANLRPGSPGVHGAGLKSRKELGWPA
jgi:hypothetical protein